MVSKVIYTTLFILTCLSSCQNDFENENSESINKLSTGKKSDSIIRKKVDFSNPSLLSTGTDIGNTFKVYYLSGKIDQMIELTSSETKNQYGIENLKKSYEKLDFGFDMKFYNMIFDSNSNTFSLYYKCDIQATKIKKVLNVVIENDSARIIPFNPIQGQIFQ